MTAFLNAFWISLAIAFPLSFAFWSVIFAVARVQGFNRRRRQEERMRYLKLPLSDFYRNPEHVFNGATWDRRR